MDQPYTYPPYVVQDPLQIEKQQARRIGNSTGGGMLLMTGVMFALSFVVSFAALLLPNGTELVSSPEFNWIYQIFASVLLFTLPFLLVPVFAKIRIGDVFAAGKVEPRLFIPLVLLALGVAALGNYGSGIVGQITDALGIRGADISDLGTPEGPWGFALMLVGSALVPALVEEFSMRGVVLGVVRNKLGDTMGILISSFLFALMHNNVASLPFTFLGGVAFGYITVYANSVWPAVTAHFLNNLLATLATEAEKYLAPSMAELMYLMYTFLFVTAGLIGFVLFTKQRDDALHLAGYSGTANQKQVAKWVFTSPCMVIYMITFVLESVLFTWLLY